MKLIVFNLSTLLSGEHVGGIYRFLAEQFGKSEEYDRIGKEYKERRKEGPWGLDQVAKLFEGVSCDEFRRACASYVDNYIKEEAKTVLRKLKEKGIMIGILTSNPYAVIDALAKKIGVEFDLAVGNEFECVEGKLSGKLKEVVDRHVRKEKLEKFISEHNISKNDIIYVACSLTDIPAAELCGNIFCVDAHDEELKEKCTSPLGNLSELLSYVEC